MNLKQQKTKNCQLVYIGLCIVFLCGMFTILQPDMVYAIGSSKVVTGSKKLFNDITKVVQIMGPIVAGAMAGWYGMKLSSADDDEVKPIKKKIKICIVGAIITLVGGTFLNVILSYYK